MELCSLHPFEPATVERYVGVLRGEAEPPSAWSAWWLESARQGLVGARAGNEEAANAVSHALALALSTEHPSFAQDGFGLTAWEARIERGVGMLLRPPSRLLMDAGLDSSAARTLPIRLDLNRGTMGGAFVPPRLVPDLYRLIDTRTDRIARRLREAEYDPVGTLGLLFEAVSYAADRGLGIYEAMDAVLPDATGGLVPGARVVGPDPKRLDRALRQRLVEAAKPPRKPGVLARLLGRGQRRVDTHTGTATWMANGRHPGEWDR